ncbi:MAG: 2-C-methyl-D-erythritol 2,4-cyclodiphosphate synthase [Bacteroidetes bacterium RBG_19FT_COMBO_42_7]|jgi:2-C-methyl-D-erythritol 2,4-cyclodiphosphate synthase|nr:MAG: 2-C-methyl-D-erythritol 2,4-cyclodiphosphate synthase [Bacteroidetes bacterium RBG_13_42_15]OFY82964.1 MAG: 2-C-methyl-D-erythritol 2,4-cyclodiphosphate synthase [Bacteroidetes bacterium RBG_19FT_COMBO_42_7]
MNIRIGQGIDFHRLETGLNLWLGGINIPYERGCVAHSDGDVLLHAVCDALLGASGLRDIGFYFPDSDPELKNIDSKILLKRTFDLISKKGYRVSNIDCTVCLEKPRIASYIPEMKNIISAILETVPENISIKATTTEKLGFTGREEGIVALAVVLITN